jgi:hypothetical protein
MLPTYETLAIRAFPVGAAVLCAMVGLLWLRRKRMPRTLLPVFILALLYFVSLPLDLTVAGAAGAHRSWSFTFIFLSLAIGTALGQLIFVVSHKSIWKKILVGLITFGMILFAFAGNMSANVNVDGRFGGPYKWGVENREPTPETAALARWFNQFPGVKIMTDSYTGMYLYSRTRTLPIPLLQFSAIIDFFYLNAPIPDAIWHDIVKQGYQYIVIDKRLNNHFGVWNAPLLGVLEGFLPEPGTLTRFQFYAWTPLIYNSSDYSVYRINFSALDSKVK